MIRKTELRRYKGKSTAPRVEKTIWISPGFPSWLVNKNNQCQCRCSFIPSRFSILVDITVGVLRMEWLWHQYEMLITFTNIGYHICWNFPDFGSERGLWSQMCVEFQFQLTNRHQGWVTRIWTLTACEGTLSKSVVQSSQTPSCNEGRWGWLSHKHTVWREGGGS